MLPVETATHALETHEVITLVRAAGLSEVEREAMLHAYDTVVEGFFAEAVAAYGRGPWGHGMERAAQALVDAVGRDLEAARFACLDVPSGCREVLKHRERTRARCLQRFYEACRAGFGAEGLTALQLELALGTIRFAVEDHLRRGREDALPQLVSVLAVTFVLR